MISDILIRERIIEICRMMHSKGFVAATDGNASMRLDKDRLIATPSGINKGFLKPDDLVITDMEGNIIEGVHAVTSEIKLHLVVYEIRKDVSAIVHAHPPVSIAFSIAGLNFYNDVIPEVIVTLGEIPITEYAMPASAEGGEVIKKYISEHNAVILTHHGSVTVGKTLEEAYNRLEKVEHAATVLMNAKTLGKINPLPEKEVRKLRAQKKY